MSDWALLALVAAGLYLIECLKLIRADEVACVRAGVPSRWRVREGTEVFGTDRGGLILADPLMLSGALVVTHPWPVAFSPEGMAPRRVNDPRGAAGDGGYVTFDEADHITVDGHALLLRGQPWARAGTPWAAHQCADQIRRLAGVAGSARQRVIIRIIRAACDEKAAAARWASTRHAVQPLARLARLLALVLCVIAPGVLVALGSYRTWPWLLALLVGVNVLTTRVYATAHRSLYPDARGDRRQQALSMLLLPLSSLRSADTLTRECMAGYAMAVTLPVVCGADEGLPLLRQRWFDAAQRTDAADTHNPAAPAAERCRQWFAACVMREEAAALARLTIALHEAPEPVAGAVAYCPRCHAQFERDTTVGCRDCPSVALVTFPPTSTSTVP